MLAICLNAGNDRNGNPRRAWVLINDNGLVVGAKDEGYGGFPYPGHTKGPRFTTTPAEYRDWLRTFADKRE